MGNIYHGDHVQAIGSNPIGKQVINEAARQDPRDTRDALNELLALLAELKDAGFVDQTQPIVEDKILEREIEGRAARFNKLFKFVSANGGPTLQNAVGGTLAGFVIEVISRLS